jgi:hypothetical protein
MIYNKDNLPKSFECESVIDGITCNVTRVNENMYRSDLICFGASATYCQDTILEFLNKRKWVNVVSKDQQYNSPSNVPVNDLLNVLKPFTRVLFNNGESMLYKGSYQDGHWHFFFNDASIKHVQTDNLEREIMQVYAEPQLAPGFISSTAPTQVLWSRYDMDQLAAWAAVKQAKIDRDAADTALIDARNRASELGVTWNK